MVFLHDPLIHNHSTSPSPAIVRMVPALSIAAIKSKLDKELALWYCLRTINYWGSGYLDHEYAAKALMEYFGYSRSAAYRTLKAGDGILWKRMPLKNSNRLQIKIYGLQKASEYFDTHCGRYFLEIATEEFVGHGKNRAMRQRSWLYASHHQPQRCTANPISRASVEVATGVKRRTQQRYDKVTRSVKLANFANQQNSDGKMVPIRLLGNGKSRQWLKHRRLGNTYHSRVLKAARGVTKKVNSLFRQSSKRGEACLTKRFFFSPRSFARATEKHQEPFLWVNHKERVMPGRVEWCLV